MTFNFFQYLFFAFPLSQVRSIFVNRDASALVPLLVFAVTINGALWAGYGMAIENYFIAGPNFIATFVGVLQIACIALFGRRKAEQLEAEQAASNGDYERLSQTDDEQDGDDQNQSDAGDNEGDGQQDPSPKQRRADKRKTNRRRKSTDLEAGS